MSVPNSYKECMTPDEAQAYFTAQAQAARKIYEEAMANLLRDANTRLHDLEIERQRRAEDERRTE